MLAPKISTGSSESVVCVCPFSTSQEDDEDEEEEEGTRTKSRLEILKSDSQPASKPLLLSVW